MILKQFGTGLQIELGTCCQFKVEKSQCYKVSMKGESYQTVEDHNADRNTAAKDEAQVLEIGTALKVGCWARVLHSGWNFVYILLMASQFVGH